MHTPISQTAEEIVWVWDQNHLTAMLQRGAFMYHACLRYDSRNLLGLARNALLPTAITMTDASAYLFNLLENI